MVLIPTVRFIHEIYGSGSDELDYLLANIGDAITVVPSFLARWELVSDGVDTEGGGYQWLSFDGDEVTFLDIDNANSNVNFLEAGFNVGDIVAFTQTASNNTSGHVITSFSDDKTKIYFSASVFVTEVAKYGVIQGTTECKGVNFRSNLIENDTAETYLSLIDENEVKYSIDNLDWTNNTYLSMLKQGQFNSNDIKIQNAIGNKVQIRGNLFGVNNFEITDTFIIMPFFLIEDLDDFINQIAPEPFKDVNTLTYAFNIEMLYNLNNPNLKHTSLTENIKIGNVGWFNENFNQGFNYYSMSELSFTVGGAAKTYADYNQETDFTITVNSENGTFSNTNTKVIVTHFWLPENEDEYKNTLETAMYNFMVDRTSGVLGGAMQNGIFYGTSKQVLKMVKANYVSATEMTITGKINLSTEYKDRIDIATDKRFVVCVSVGDHTLDWIHSDRVTLIPKLPLNHINTYDKDLSNVLVGNSLLQFIHRPQSDLTSPTLTMGHFTEDLLINKTTFHVDITDGALINNCSVIVKAIHPTYGSFNLEKKNWSFANAVVVSGIQDIVINDPRGYDLKSGDPFNIISLLRKSSLDVGNDKYYELFYPFTLRYEDFEKLNGVISQFYDNTQKFNGYNHDWSRYYDGSGWLVQFEFLIEIIENGVTNTFSNTLNSTIHTYEEATDWQDEDILLYEDSTSIAQGTFMPTNVLLRVEAVAKYIGVPVLTVNDLEGEITIERYELDGSKKIERISTVWVNADNKILVSVLGNNLCKIEAMPLDVYKLSCLIDNTKLDLTADNYKISARIYQPPFGGVPIGKQFEDGNYFEFEDGNLYEFE